MKIIVISGFAEFEYARESINLAVSEYLLKPFATKRLLEVALRLKAEMSEEQAKELGKLLLCGPRLIITGRLCGKSFSPIC